MLTDERIEELILAGGGRRHDESFWKIEDADLHPTARAIEAEVRKQAGAVAVPKFLALRFHARRDKKATVTLLFSDHEAADAWVRGIKEGGQYGTE